MNATDTKLIIMRRIEYGNYRERKKMELSFEQRNIGRPFQMERARESESRKNDGRRENGKNMGKNKIKRIKVKKYKI